MGVDGPKLKWGNEESCQFKFLINHFMVEDCVEEISFIVTSFSCAKCHTHQR